MDFQSIYHWLVLGGLLLMLGNVLANLCWFDGLVPAEPPQDAPLVSVLVPARNEEVNIGPCVASLLAQDYPELEVLVLDDHSTDATARIAEQLIAAAKEERPSLSARLLGGQSLPEGWAGKNWACHQLAGEARGEFLFFTDADTVHAPGTVSAAVAYARKNRASLVSAWPRLLTGTFGEKLIVPVILLIGMAFCPLWRHRRAQQRNPEGANPARLRDSGAANGQFMFFTRRAYESIGGHAALRGHVVEDVTLGREVAERIPKGERLFNCEALQFSTVRMYRSFGDTWAGFTKNIRAAFDDRWFVFWMFGCIEGACLLGPFIAIFFAPTTLRPLVLAQIGVIYFIRFLLAARFRTSLLGALLHPLGVLLMMLIGVNSWRHSRGRGVVWKGRVYRPEI